MHVISMKEPEIPMQAPVYMPPQMPYNPYMMPMNPGYMMPYGAPSPYGASNPYGAPSPYGAPNSYGAPSPYNAPAPGYYQPMNPLYSPVFPGVMSNPAINKKPFVINPLTNKPPGFKTLPCRNFHSVIGCQRGDNCHFVHDFTFQGRPIPNFEQWKHSNEERLKNITQSSPVYFPPPPANK